MVGIDPATGATRTVVNIGRETGRIIEPIALSLGPNDRFAVADAPGPRERVQIFDLTGQVTGGFYLPARTPPRLVVDDVAVNGIGSLAFTGTTVLVNQPESGALFAEVTPRFTTLRQVGTLRPTGHEADRDLHASLNVGRPVIDPTGGTYFVFLTGLPMFRKYDADGALAFERHVEGPELDALVAALPTTWSGRPEGHTPVVPSLVRTAACDAAGRLWISLTVPYTYVYDARGEKIRTVQLAGADVFAATSLFFTPAGRLLAGPDGYLYEVR